MLQVTQIKLDPINLVVLQGTSLCNLNCSYCYLSEESRKQEQKFSLEDLVPVFTRIFKSPFLRDTLKIVWHAGEPLTLPIDYYRQSWSTLEELKNKYVGPDFELSFSIQTNATLITPEWCELFKEYEHQLKLGVSCDGPDFLHDRYRQNWGGYGSYANTIRGMEMLYQHNLPFAVLATITPNTLEFPDAFFEFFQHHRAMFTTLYMNFLNNKDYKNVELIYDAELEKKYYEFLRTILKRLKNIPDAFNVSNFSEICNTIYHLADLEQNNFNDLGYIPLRTLNIDRNGNVSTFIPGLGGVSESCNPYGDGKGFIIGNLLHQDLEEMLSTKKFDQMCSDFKRTEDACRAVCENYVFCVGGNPATKYETYGTFDIAETAECRVSVKGLVKAVLDELQDHFHLNPISGD